MTRRDKWDCFIMVWSVFAVANYLFGISGDVVTRFVGAVCLFGIIVGLFGRSGLFGRR